MRRASSKLLTILLTLSLGFAGTAFAAGGAIYVDAAQVSWDAAPGFRLTLSVSGPGDFHLRQAFAPGETPRFGAFSEAGDLLADGVYSWELAAVPAKTAKRSASETLGAVKGFVRSGAFSLAGGAFADPRVPEEVGGEKDQVINDDLIVDGSACIGFDCVNGESFGFDTLRLKENNLRIKFQDTSTSASFPTNDWQLTANETSNGGLNKFSIDDIDGGRTPFTIVAGAPSHSLYVDAQGDVGLGTSTPVVELHVVDGDTPTLRLEQNGSSGFTPQTWDLAGNETNFFVRDATNGSTLPFRIRPGAPTSSIDVAASGNVGIGTTTPDSNLDIEDDNPEIRLTGTASSQEWEIRVNNAGRLNFQVDPDGTNNTALRIDQQAGNNLLNVGVDAADVVSVNGSITATGTITPDFVFEPHYPLPSIEEQAVFMWREKHLPAVAPGKVNAKGEGVINLSARAQGVLEELEKAHIYIEQLHTSMKALQERVAELEATDE